MSLLVTSDILSSGTSDVEAVVKLLVASEAAGSRGGGGRWRSIAVATLLWNANRNSYAIYQMVPFPMTLK